MNKAILKKEVQNWINKNLSKNPLEIALGKSPFVEVSPQELAEQVKGKRKSQKKLPTWYQNNHVFYPKTLSIEQTSSEALAKYKANLVKGNTLLDVTGGFGVDSYYFSKKSKHVIHCEKNKELSEIAHHNALALNIPNISFYKGDGIEKLKNLKEKVDVVYLDPARRHQSKGKVISLADYEPNVLENLELLFEKTKTVLIKTSPMLDLQIGMEQLANVTEVHAVAYNNELKELVWVLERISTLKIKVLAVNLRKNKQDEVMEFFYEEPNQAVLANKIGAYLYEPNAAIMKVQGYKYLIPPFFKLAENTHLFTSDILQDFPGRKFKILQYFLFNKKEVLKNLKGTKANISCRNFPLSPQEVKNKFKIMDGGEQYVFFTTLSNQKVVLICKKVENYLEHI